MVKNDTKGIITLAKKGRVIMKIIAMSNANNAKKLADFLLKNWPVDILKAYDFALTVGFGTYDDLVVLTKHGTEYLGIDYLDDKYRYTFKRIDYNPGWEEGNPWEYLLLEV